MTNPPDYVLNTQSVAPMHNRPAPSYDWQQMPADQQKVLWDNLLESVWQQFLLWVQGVLLPGPAGVQLTDWAAQINADIIAWFAGVGNDLQAWINSVFGGPGSNSIPSNSAATWSAITALQQAGNPGQSVSVDFSTLANTTNLPAIFTQSYSGAGTDTFGVESGRAKLTSLTSPTTARATTALYNVLVTNTDIQIVSGSWSSGPVNDGFGNRAYCRLDGRKNAADTSKVFVEFAADSAQLGCIVAGTPTIFATIGNGGTGFFYFKPGALYTLRCGTPSPAAADRVFTVLENGAPIIGPFTDGSAVSQMGASYRGGGLAARWPTSGGNVRPGELQAWGFADN